METASSLPHVNRSRCTLCGACVQACPCGAIELTEEGPVFHCAEVCSPDGLCPRGGVCWLVCEEACPEGAIECPFEIVLEADDQGD
jgi:ferredoxin